MIVNSLCARTFCKNVAKSVQCFAVDSIKHAISSFPSLFVSLSLSHSLWLCVWVCNFISLLSRPLANRKTVGKSNWEKLLSTQRIITTFRAGNFSQWPNGNAKKTTFHWLCALTIFASVSFANSSIGLCERKLLIGTDHTMRRSSVSRLHCFRVFASMHSSDIYYISAFCVWERARAPSFLLVDRINLKPSLVERQRFASISGITKCKWARTDSSTEREVAKWISIVRISCDDVVSVWLSSMFACSSTKHVAFYLNIFACKTIRRIGDNDNDITGW